MAFFVTSSILFNASGLSCYGLAAVPSATTANACKAWCVAGSACDTYLFDDTSLQCWAGEGVWHSQNDDSPSRICEVAAAKSHWVGGSKLPVPPSGSRRRDATHLIATAAASNFVAGTPSFIEVPVAIYKMTTAALPASPTLPANASARTVFWNEAPLTLTFWPVDAGAFYELELEFLDDGVEGQGRVESITMAWRLPAVAGSPTAVTAGCAIELGLPLNRTAGVVRYELPRTAVEVLQRNASVSTLTLQIAKTRGPNTVLSSARLFSSNAAAPMLTPRALPPIAPLPLPSKLPPRLSPRPSAVAGVDDPILSLNGVWTFDTAPPLKWGGASTGAGNTSDIVVPGEYTLQGHRVAAGTRVRYTRALTLPLDWCAAHSAAAGEADVVMRVKLRFDGCYSSCVVALNGVVLGTHLGGFTPFELDVTAEAKATCGMSAPNALAVDVTGEATVADTLASASRYAGHDLGGIPRKVYAMVLPSLAIADVHSWTSKLAPPPKSGSASAPRAATVSIVVTLANDGDAIARAGAIVNVTLCAPPAPAAGGRGERAGKGSGACVAQTICFGSVYPGERSVSEAITFDLAAAALWDAEHPRLHTLSVSRLASRFHALPRAGAAATPSGARCAVDVLPALDSAGADAVETVVSKIGVRTVKVVGNKVLVNGVRIKARGAARHETHPMWGRALWSATTPGGTQWRADIAAFKSANINFIRTSHYPPAEELMDAADELGMMIELEMPFCWALKNEGSADFNYTVQAQSEAVVFNRNHAAVTFWSLGNESPFSLNFQLSLRDFLRPLDATRPFAFDGGNEQTFVKNASAPGQLDIETAHYPGGNGANFSGTRLWPTSFGEYAHLNCYNRREILADEGLRVNWAWGTHKVWEMCYANDNVMGAFLWAGLDDQFYMPPLNASAPKDRRIVGYGPWGVIDNWRREKPETVAVRNIYSPVIIEGDVGASVGNTTTVANRYSFSDLSEVVFRWRALDGATPRATGTARASGAPYTTGNALRFAPPLPARVSAIELNATFGGVLVNTWHLGGAALRTRRVAAAREQQQQQQRAPAAANKITVIAHKDGSLTIVIGGSTTAWTVSASGSIAATVGAAGPSETPPPLVTGGPTLMVLAPDGAYNTELSEGNDRDFGPWTAPLANWSAASPPSWVVDGAGDTATVTVRGTYVAQASGFFTLVFRTDTSLVIAWKCVAPTRCLHVFLPHLSRPSLPRASPLLLPPTTTALFSHPSRRVSLPF